MPRAMWSARKNDIDAIPAPFAFLGKKPKKPTNFLDLSLLESFNKLNILQVNKVSVLIWFFSGLIRDK